QTGPAWSGSRPKSGRPSKRPGPTGWRAPNRIWTRRWKTSSRPRRGQGAMKATFAKIIAMTLGEEMRRDPKVLLLGEDVQTGIQGTTSGLVAEFGPERVWNTPLSESGFTGVGIGLAAVGYRPVVDLMYGTFTYVAMDQLANQAAKLR